MAVKKTAKAAVSLYKSNENNVNEICDILNRKSRAFVTIFTALFPMYFPYP